MEIIALKAMGFSSNCFIIQSGKEAFVVDPSINEKTVLSELKKRELSLKGILLTHGHFDHIWRAKELKGATGAPVYVHELDAEMLTDSRKNAFATFTGGNFVIDEADVLLHAQDKLSLGDEEITVMHTPGHTKGSVCFDTGDSLITGDTIFAQGFGRCDLYGGDMSALKQSIKMLTEMAKTESRWIYPGHGDSSTLRQATENLKYYF